MMLPPVIKKPVWYLLRRLRIADILQLKYTSGLSEDGWFRSFATLESVDAHGNPLPWCTYPFIKFIAPRLNKKMDVFEFGSGNSTRWYAERTGSVKSVEHDKEWHNKVRDMALPGNVELVFRDLTENGPYSQEASVSGKKYHIIIVDGRDRNNCLLNSIDSLTDDGVFVFDNTDRPQYKPSLDKIASRGFKRIDFVGLAPIIPHNSCTSILYRSDNCLGV